IRASRRGSRWWRATSCMHGAWTSPTCASTSSACASTASRPGSSTSAAPSRRGADVLDIRLIRADPAGGEAELAKGGGEPAQVDALLDADGLRREAIQAVETLRAERTAASKAIRDQKDPAAREAAIAAQRVVGERIATAEAAVAAAEAEFERRMLELPNLPHPGVPVGPA